MAEINWNEIPYDGTTARPDSSVQQFSQIPNAGEIDWNSIPYDDERPEQSNALYGGFKRGVGGILGTAGRMTGLQTLSDYGKEVVDANQQKVAKTSDILGNPGTFAAETVGEVAPDIVGQSAATAAGAAIGSIAGPPGIALGAGIGRYGYSFARSYDGIKQQQEQDGNVNEVRAIIGAAASAGVDFIGPVSKVAGKIGEQIFRKGERAVVQEIAEGGEHALVKYGLKPAVSVGKEAGTEGIQQVIENYAGTGTPGTLEDIGMAALKGGIGGLAAHPLESLTEKAPEPVAPPPAPVAETAEPDNETDAERLRRQRAASTPEAGQVVPATAPAPQIGLTPTPTRASTQATVPFVEPTRSTRAKTAPEAPEPTPEPVTPTGTRVEAYTSAQGNQNRLVGPHAGRIASMEGLKQVPNKPGQFIVPDDRLADINHILDPKAPVETPSEQLDMKLAERAKLKREAPPPEEQARLDAMDQAEQLQAPPVDYPTEEEAPKTPVPKKTLSRKPKGLPKKKAPVPEVRTKSQKLDDQTLPEHDDFDSDVTDLQDRLSQTDFSHETPRRPLGVVTAERVRDIKLTVDKVLSGFKVKPNIKYFDNFRDPKQVPSEVVDYASSKGIRNPSAFRRGNVVYLNTAAIRSEADVIEQLHHEAFGGHISQELYHGDGFHAAMHEVADGQVEEANRLVQEHGYDLNNPKDKAKIGSEIISHLAQKNPRHPLVHKVISKIREILKKLGLIKGLSDSEIIHKYVIPAREMMRTGEGVKGKVDRSKTEFNNRPSNEELFAMRNRLQKEIDKGNLSGEQVADKKKLIESIDDDLHENDRQPKLTVVPKKIKEEPTASPESNLTVDEAASLNAEPNKKQGMKEARMVQDNPETKWASNEPRTTEDDFQEQRNDETPFSGDTDFQHESMDAGRTGYVAGKYDSAANIFRSASDLLKQSAGRVAELGRALQNHVTAAQTNRGIIQKFVVPISNHLDTLTRAERKTIVGQVNNWIKSGLTGQKYDSTNDNPDAVKFQQAIRGALDALGVKMSKLGMMATNPRTGSKIPFKMRPDFIPAILLPKVRMALTYRKGKDGYTKDFKELADKVIASGYKYKGKTLKTIDEVDAFVKEAMDDGNFESGFFGDMGMSKALPFPTDFYDGSVDAMKKYMDRAAERIAQVEAFTVEDSKGKNMDLFDLVLHGEKDNKKETGLDSKDPRYTYITSLKSLIYNDRAPKTNWERIGQTLNTIATGTQLAGFKSVLNNTVGGLGNIFAFMDVKHVIAGFQAYTNPEFRRAVQDFANNEGITSDQAFSIIADSEGLGISQYPGLNKISRLASDATSRLMGLRTGSKILSPLKAISFNTSENAIRRLTAAASIHELTAYVKEYKINSLSRKSLIFEQICKEEGIDIGKLTKEEGWSNSGKFNNSPQSVRFIQRMTNRVQGSYRLDQIPKFLDTGWGRFLFKYNKYGYQLARMFDKQVIGYMRTPGMRREGAENLLKYLTVYSTMGAAAAMIVRGLFGDDKLPTLEEWKNAWDEKSKHKNFDQYLYLMSQIGLSIHSLGAFGPGSIGYNALTQYNQYGDSPFAPPGMAILDNTARLIGKWLWSGEQESAKDIGWDAFMFASKILTPVNQSMQLAGEWGHGFDEFKSGRVLARSRSAVNRFIKDSDEVKLKARSKNWVPVVPNFEEVGNKNRGLNESVNRKLMVGDYVGAKAAYDRVIKKMTDNGEPQADVDKMKNEISSSIIARRPFAVYGEPAGKEATKMFKDWAEKNLPKKDFEEMEALDDAYMVNAYKAKLIKHEWLEESAYTRAYRKYLKGQKPAKKK